MLVKVIDIKKRYKGTNNERRSGAQEPGTMWARAPPAPPPPPPPQHFENDEKCPFYSK